MRTYIGFRKNTRKNSRQKLEKNAVKLDKYPVKMEKKKKMEKIPVKTESFFVWISSYLSQSVGKNVGMSTKLDIE